MKHPYSYLKQEKGLLFFLKVEKRKVKKILFEGVVQIGGE
jgi:hypothetical protein